MSFLLSVTVSDHFQVIHPGSSQSLLYLLFSSSFSKNVTKKRHLPKGGWHGSVSCLRAAQGFLAPFLRSFVGFTRDAMLEGD